MPTRSTGRWTSPGRARHCCWPCLEEKVLDLVLERISALGLLRSGGRQRTDSTHVLTAVRTLNRMEFVGETLRAALEALAVAAPDWLSGLVTADWAKRYRARVDSYRFPKGENVRAQWAEQVGRDGFTVLEAVHAPGAPNWLREIPAVQILRRAWVEQYHRDGEGGALAGGQRPPAGQTPTVHALRPRRPRRPLRPQAGLGLVRLQDPPL
ncbi:hypothetical protein [Streptomyces chartreusis]|uniref:hypothetical protein n=1 Tax=Streptomyces chartreusis TaxID=1969 RepID=UPI003811CFFC